MMPGTEISIEAQRVLLFSQDGRIADQQIFSSSSIWCGLCRSHLKPISRDEATILTRVCSRAILRQVEEGLIHYMETSDGRQFLCPNSL